tara:strand:+ start:588 stop:1880 length:1293 start_codon:yes stop_codon:yes gene_type:complete
MALTQISTGMLASGDGTVDLNIDNGTFVIDVSTSRVGIGTGSPAVRTEINSTTSGLPVTSGTTQTNGVLRLSSSATSGIIDFGMNGTNPWIQSTGSDGLGATYNLLLNPNGGNVGIGTSSPGAGIKLDVRGNVRIGDGTAAEQDILFSNSNTEWQVGLNNAGNGTDGNHFYFYEGSNYRLTIQKGGNVGIGTSSPAVVNNGAGRVLDLANAGSAGTTADNTELVVRSTSRYAALSFMTPADKASSINFGDTDDANIGIVQYNHADDVMSFFTNATERMRINSSGIMTVARTPGFVAIIGSSQTIAAGVRGLSGNFWTTIHHNMDGHFSTTTGKFTAPVTGLYWFNVSLSTGPSQPATTYFGAEIYHNTTRITTGWNEHTTGYQKTNASYQLYMTAGETAHAGVESQVNITLVGSSTANTRYCVFSGYLIG